MFNRLSIVLLAIATACVSYAGINETIAAVKKNVAPDRRVAMFNVKAVETPSGFVLKGKIDNPDSKKALIDRLSAEGFTFTDSITLLPDGSLKPWAMVYLPYAHVRTTPGHDAELTTQSLMGTPLRVLEKEDGWIHIQTPENYIAWIIAGSVKMMTDEELAEWRKSPRYVVTAAESYLYEYPDQESIVSNLVLGDILTVSDAAPKGYVALTTPDGREGYVKADDVEEFAEWANQEFNPDLIESTARKLLGSIYTWGGTSTNGVDCSGLTKTCYFANAIILQRDASQQVLYGGKINPTDWKKAKLGDLLYFGTKSGKVTHTAIYLRDGQYIHSSGRVKINSVDPEAPDYLTTPFLSINRIEGYVDTPGIKSVKKHPWYFNQKD